MEDYADESGVHIQWVESGEIEKDGPERLLADVDGVLIPGGFGIRGIEGKVDTIRYARDKSPSVLRNMLRYAVCGD